MKKLVILTSLCLVTGAHAAKWNRSNNPENFNLVATKRMNYSFSDLPLSAKIQDDRVGWSETYWPSDKGGIAYRWNSQNPEPFKYKLKTKAELMSMSQSEFSELSPAELYDVAVGDYNFSLTKKVLSLYSPTDLWWEGICHGWALAASHYPEPDKTVVRNRDGIRVPFGASDVKGLLSMHDAYNSKGIYSRVGDRCTVRGKVEGEALPQDGIVPVPTQRQRNKDACSDVNAGTFHIVLASMIGINSQGFVADVDRFADVWNQPVTGYESKVVRDLGVNSSEMRRGIDRKILVKTIMTYGEELVFYTPEKAAKGDLNFVSKEPVTATPAQIFSERNYEYVLELDRSGRIIGGDWVSESRPDMLWLKKRDAQFLDGKLPLSGLNRIYTPVKH